jgi:hypothetical protein
MDVTLRDRSEDAGTRLEPMLVRLPPTLADRLRQLARTTRIRQSDYLREAVSDLLDKYAQHVEPNRVHPDRP